MQDLRLLVKSPADSVAAELAHDRETVRLGVALDRVADVADGGPGANLRDAEPHALIGHLAQPARRDRGFADEEHAAGVAVKTVAESP